MAELDNGGGGGSTDTTESPDSSPRFGTEQEGGTLTIIFPQELRQLISISDALVFIVKNPTVFVVAALTGFTVDRVAFLLTQKSPVAILVDDYLFRTVLLPIGAAIFAGGLNAINEFILLLFGTDRAVGVAQGARPGLVDIPFVLVEPAIQGFLNIGLVVFNTVNVFNQSLAQDLEGVGLAAPLLVNFIWAMELTVIGAAIWFMISFIPVFNVRGIILALTALPRRAFRRLL